MGHGYYYKAVLTEINRLSQLDSNFLQKGSLPLTHIPTHMHTHKHKSVFVVICFSFCLYFALLYFPAHGSFHLCLRLRLLIFKKHMIAWFCLLKHALSSYLSQDLTDLPSLWCEQNSLLCFSKRILEFNSMGLKDLLLLLGDKDKFLIHCVSQLFHLKTMVFIQ